MERNTIEIKELCECCKEPQDGGTPAYWTYINHDYIPLEKMDGGNGLVCEKCAIKLRHTLDGLEATEFESQFETK